MDKPTTIQEELSEISRTIAEINKELVSNPVIPSDYFNQLSDDILSKIRQEEGTMEELPNTLQNISKVNVYEVPEGYFNDLHENLQIEKSDKGKIIPLKKNLVPFKQMAAAIVIGIVGFSLINLFNSFNHKPKEKEIDETFVYAEAKRIIQEGSLDQEIKSLNEEDINEFLTSGGDDVYAALVASSIDENELPDAEDYFIDDETLNQYLNKFNINKTKINN